MDVTGGWKKLHNEEHCDLYFSSDNIWIIKSRRTKWAGHIAHCGEETYIHSIGEET
jgi:hypothetical protein